MRSTGIYPLRNGEPFHRATMLPSEAQKATHSHAVMVEFGRLTLRSFSLPSLAALYTTLVKSIFTCYSLAEHVDTDRLTPVCHRFSRFTAGVPLCPREHGRLRTGLDSLRRPSPATSRSQTSITDEFPPTIAPRYRILRDTAAKKFCRKIARYSLIRFSSLPSADFTVSRCARGRVSRHNTQARINSCPKSSCFARFANARHARSSDGDTCTFASTARQQLSPSCQPRRINRVSASCSLVPSLFHLGDRLLFKTPLFRNCWSDLCYSPVPSRAMLYFLCCTAVFLVTAQRSRRETAYVVFVALEACTHEFEN